MTAINATMIDHREEDKIWIDETDPTAHQETVYLNSHMKEKISEFREKIKIEFVTYSAYDVEEDIHGAAI